MTDICPIALERAMFDQHRAKQFGYRGISPETLHLLLQCDTKQGLLWWRERPRELFANKGAWVNWNSRFAGKPALNVTNGSGYKVGALFDISFLAHRVIWTIHHMSWPDGDLDHINGDRTDNRIGNLRVASRQENVRNSKRPQNNSSGVTGVARSGKKWRAIIHCDGKSLNLGLFEDKISAIAARRAAEEELGYAEGHGRSPEFRKKLFEDE